MRVRDCGRGVAPRPFFRPATVVPLAHGCRLMRTFGQQAAYVVTHPGAFTVCVLRAFRANQGLLLAGAVAYYTLLSIVPLLILMLIALSQIIDQGELLATLGRYLEWLIPGQSGAVIGELASFLDHRGVIGWVLLATMVFFSSLAFTVLENAMSVIFLHRVVIRRRHFLVSAVIPYCYILVPGTGPAVDDARLGVAPGDRRGKHRLSRTQLVAPRDFGGAALPHGGRGRDTRAHVDLPRHAGRTAVMAARPRSAPSPRRRSGRSPATSWSGISGPCPRSAWSTGR